jgi:hypothetical protein
LSGFTGGDEVWRAPQKILKNFMKKAKNPLDKRGFFL